MKSKKKNEIQEINTFLIWNWWRDVIGNRLLLLPLLLLLLWNGPNYLRNLLYLKQIAYGCYHKYGQETGVRTKRKKKKEKEIHFSWDLTQFIIYQFCLRFGIRSKFRYSVSVCGCSKLKLMLRVRLMRRP